MLSIWTRSTIRLANYISFLSLSEFATFVFAYRALLVLPLLVSYFMIGSPSVQLELFLTPFPAQLCYQKYPCSGSPGSAKHGAFQPALSPYFQLANSARYSFLSNKPALGLRSFWTICTSEARHWGLKFLVENFQVLFLKYAQYPHTLLF